MPASILVVDDESTITDALQLLLSDRGYDVIVASTAKEAETLLARRWFDLAFLDGCPWDAIEMVPTDDWEAVHGITLPDAPPAPPA